MYGSLENSKEHIRIHLYNLELISIEWKLDLNINPKWEKLPINFDGEIKFDFRTIFVNCDFFYIEWSGRIWSQDAFPESCLPILSQFACSHARKKDELYIFSQ